MKLKSGWSFDREVFSKHARAVFDAAIADRRVKVSLPGEIALNQRFGGMEGETIRGTRFNSYDAVLARLESMFTEAEFLGEIEYCIDYALTDAAKADHWEKYEEDYGHEDHECCEEDGSDY